MLRLTCGDIFGDRDVFSISKWAGLFSRQLVGVNTFMTKQDVDDLNKEKIKILFSQGHKEQLVLTEDADDESLFSSLRQVLTGLGYAIGSTKGLTYSQLADARILVVGVPQRDFKPKELDAIEQFVQAGGGLLLVSNAETMIAPPRDMNQKIAEMAGRRLEFDPSDANPGIFFVAADGSATRVDVEGRNKPDELMFLTPALAATLTVTQDQLDLIPRSTGVCAKLSLTMSNKE